MKTYLSIRKCILKMHTIGQQMHTPAGNHKKAEIQTPLNI